MRSSVRFLIVDIAWLIQFDFGLYTRLPLLAALRAFAICHRTAAGAFSLHC
jgi:hypothetical protein